MCSLPVCEVRVKLGVSDSAVQADANKICDWRSEVLAAEAKKAGSSSERT